jgi:choline transport protein
LVGLIVQGMIIINNESFVPQNWHGALLANAFALGTALFNVFGAKYLPLLEAIFVSCHVICLLPILITVLVMTPVKQTPSAVFTDFTDNGGDWPNMGLTVMVGQVAASFILLGTFSQFQ